LELLFGTNVREYGQLVGRLAGFELDPTTHRVLSIFISSDGELGNHVVVRPFASVLPEPGEIDIRPYTQSGERPQREGVVLGHTARIVRSGREAGRLAGADVAVGTGELEGVIGRRSWWTRRFTLPAKGIDLSVPGQVRIPGSGSRAA
jgi:hypothetical protein